MRLGEVKGTRFGVHPNTPLYLELRHEWQQSPYADGHLVDWVDVNPSIKRPDYPPDQLVPFLPMEAVDEDAAGYHEQQRAFGEVTTGYTIFERGDVIWAKITPCMQNGKSALLDDLSGPVGFGSTEFHVLRPRKRDGDRAISRRFLFELLSLPRLRLAATSTFGGSAGQQRVPEDFLENLPAVVPPDDFQKRIVKALDAARAARRRKLEEAESLLGGLDAFVLETLGLTLPPPDGRTVYAVRLRDVERGRFDPHFFCPEYRELSRRLAKTPHRALGKLVRLSHEIWSPRQSDAATFRYIEISGVNTTTGEATAVDTPVAEAPSRARMQVRSGDVIVSLTRPHYGAIAAIDDSLDGCIASTGFAVLREALVDDLNRSYLWTILRCQITLMQFQQRSSGGNYPAITEEELERVLVPVPDSPIQKKIAAEVSRRRDAARRLREEAAQLWDDAKRRFEEALLGPAAPANRGGR